MPLYVPLSLPLPLSLSLPLTLTLPLSLSLPLSDQVWDVTFATHSLAGWDVAQDPVIMCDVTRFTARGATITNTTFHHTTCNLGRMKASDSLISDR